MNTQKILKNYSWLFIFLLAITACEKEEDKEKVYLSTPVAGELIGTTDKIVLEYDESGTAVLSFVWGNNNTLYLSNSDKPIEDAVMVYLQASTTEDFSENVISNKESSLSKAYTGSELNILTKNLNIPPFEATDIYFRLRYTPANNIEGVYSNTVKVNVTGFYTDMTIATLLNKEQTEVVGKIYSPEENGIYTGFVYATSWMNFFWQEGNGKIWGNNSAVGKFSLTSVSPGNSWYPEPAGCYYTVMDTQEGEWTALYIPTLTVSGNITGEMTLTNESLKWTMPCTITSAGTITIKIVCSDAQLYDRSTGDMDYNPSSLAFSQKDNTLEIASEAGDITISAPAAGNYTFELDVTDPTNWTCKLIN